MKQRIHFEVSVKENVYFTIKFIFSVLIYLALAALIVVLATSENSEYNNAAYLSIPYVLLIVIILILRNGLLIGYLSGNAIRVNSKQFPDIYNIVDNQSNALGLSSNPKVYILQNGGLLNAFVTKFLGTNYIVLYSDIVDQAYQQDINILEFVIGHELGHIKRKHGIKKLLLLPSMFIPFLSSAYSRACEYTCDNIGCALAPEGAKNGILLLAAGGSFKKVNAVEFINQDNQEDGFWKWFAEKISSHPDLTKRLKKFKITISENIKIPSAKPVIHVAEENDKPNDADHSKYMPRM